MSTRLPTPIVLVPGIMGTRLVDRHGAAVWDPDPQSATRSFLRAVRHLPRLFDLTTTLEPNPTAPPEARDLLAQRGVVNGGHLVWAAYDNLVRGLTSRYLHETCPGGVRLYVAGYDWRQSNRRSAGRHLRQVIGTARAQTGSADVIVVAHSMGGLVARAFGSALARSGHRGAHPVRGCVLTGSPTHGAPAMYRVLRQSYVGLDDLADFAVRDDTEDDDAEGLWLGRRFAELARRLPSTFELLPGRVWCDRHPDWVRFRRSSGRLTDASDPDLLYADRIVGVNGRMGMLRARRRFDQTVGNYLLPNTYVVFGSRLETESHYLVLANGRLRQAGTRRQNRGDTRVPAYSGAAEGMPRQRRPKAQHDLGAIGHGAVANSAPAVARIIHSVAELCRHQSLPAWSGEMVG